MILEDCEKIKTLVVRYQDYQRNVGVIEALKPNREKLEALRTALDAEVTRIEVLRSHDSLSSDALDEVKTTVSKALESLKKVRDGFEIDPMNLTRGRDFRYLCDRYTAICTSLKEIAKIAWREYVKKACPVVDDDVLRQFDRTEREVVRAIRSIQLRADGIRNRIPTSAAEFQDASSVFQQLREALARLPDVSDNPEVKAFLDATIQEEGAPLSLLTPAVQQWLYDKGRDDHYRIWAGAR